MRFKQFENSKWIDVKLGDVATFVRGSGLDKSKLNVDCAGGPVVHYADLYKFNPVQKHVIHYSTSSDGVFIPENSLLFPISDVTPTGLATTSTLLQSGVRAGSDMLIATLNPDFDAGFFSYILNHERYKILRLVVGSTVRHISSKDLKSISVSAPSLDEQIRIRNYLDLFDSKHDLLIKKANEVSKLKTGYLEEFLKR